MGRRDQRGASVAAGGLSSDDMLDQIQTILDANQDAGNVFVRQSLSRRVRPVGLSIKKVGE